LRLGPESYRNTPHQARLQVIHSASARAFDEGHLTKQQRESSNARWKKLHQFLSEIGVKALRTQLGQLLGIARISNSKEDYEKYFKKLFGEQFELFEN
jgi:hypothetical protein